MTTRIHANNFATTINGAISNSATSIVLTSVTGFPVIGGGVTCNLTLQSGATIEIVTATARSSNTLTVTRGAEGTSGVAWADLSSISIRPTADSVDRKIDTAGGASSGKLLQSNGTSWGASTATWPTAATSTKFIIGNGTNYVESTSTIPTSAGATALKHLKSDGTNYVLTTATISDTPSTAGKMLVSDGTNWITSTPTFPNASATTRKIIVSDGTNWTASTETYAVPGTAKKYLKSDGTNWTSATPDTSPVASTLGAWDANNNFSANNFLTGYTTTATSAGTKTLVIGDTEQQVYTGSTTHTQVMPVVSTLALGTLYITTNLSSGVVTVQSSGTNTVQAMAANTTLILQSNATSGTGASVWTVVAYYAAASGITGSGSSVRATSPALVTPDIGTPTAGTLTSCTGLPISGIASLGTGVGSALAQAVLGNGTKLKVAGATAFRVYANTNQAIANNTSTKIQLDSKTFDNGTMFDATTNYRFTPTIAGNYFISGCVVFTNTLAANSLIVVKIYKNGGNTSENISYSPNVINSYGGSQVNAVVSMNGSTDYVELYALQVSGSSVNVIGVNTDTFMSGFLVE